MGSNSILLSASRRLGFQFLETLKLFQEDYRPLISSKNDETSGLEDGQRGNAIRVCNIHKTREV